MAKKYELTPLPYGYGDLAPYMSEEQLRLHHDKHHLAYVNGANTLMDKLEKARKDNADLDIKATLKELSFHLGGHELHSTFWQNMAPAGKGGGGKPSGLLGDQINRDYGGFDRFRKEYTQAAVSTEGSGWAVLIYCKKTGRLIVQQVEKHNVNYPPGYSLLMALDVWEHAYYVDYKNDRAKFVEGFWNVVNWEMVNRWFADLKPEMAAARQ